VDICSKFPRDRPIHLPAPISTLSTNVLFQVVEDGYEFFAKRQLVTLFSAPNYCGEFDNAGAMMSVDETLLCSFQVGSGYFPLRRYEETDRGADFETGREKGKVPIQ
jgi:hypothetical protein